MRGRIALLDAPIPAPPEQAAIAVKQCGADRNSAFAQADPRLLEGDRQHPEVTVIVRHLSVELQRGLFTGYCPMLPPIFKMNDLIH